MISKPQSVPCHWTIIFCITLPLMIFARSQRVNSQLYQSSSIQDTVKILWTDEIRLNDIFLRNIIERQRSDVGYIVVQCGNECRWDGPKNCEESNLRYKLTDTMKLGFMWSSAQISYL